MKITEVLVKLPDRPRSNDRVLAYCSIILDGELAGHDIRILRLPGKIFVAMPSRKVTDSCPRCRGHNHLMAAFCNECGNPLEPSRAPVETNGKLRVQVDVTHPINAELRLYFERTIIDAYVLETAKRGRLFTEPFTLPDSHL